MRARGDLGTRMEILLAGVIDALPATLAVLDARGTILLVNAPWWAFARENGLRMDDAGVGANYVDVCRAAAAGGDPYAARAVVAIEGVRSGETPIATFEYPCHSPDTQRWFIFRAAGFDADGAPHLVVTHTDISARRASEDELRASRDALAAFNLAVSHDIRAPLRRIETLSRLATEEDDTPPAELLARIRVEATRARALAADLLDLARTGSAALARTRVDLSAIARQVVQDLRGPSDHIDIRIQEGMVDNADETRVRLILSNLLSNAVKYTSRTPDARIEVGASSTGAIPVFYVRDNGIGFDPADATRLFQPFYRADAAQPFEGTGIGLAIVRRAAQQHGGSAWADGAPGEGATFYFTLHAG